MDKAWTTPPAPCHARPLVSQGLRKGSVARSVATFDVARLDGRGDVPVDVLERPPRQLPGTSAGSTSPIRRQPFDSSHVRAVATSGTRSASA